MSKPTVRGAEAMKHLCRYLLHTKDYGLMFSRDLQGCDYVTVMTDSDWATDVATRKSRSAVHIYVGYSLLYSFTRRQSVIVQSSGEAELYATAAGVSEGILLRKVLGFCGMILGLRTISDSAAKQCHNPQTRCRKSPAFGREGVVATTDGLPRFADYDLATRQVQQQ